MTAALATRVCASTGLTLVRSTRQCVLRVAREKRGPLHPRQQDRLRPASNHDAWKRWGRWDVPGHRTIYAADTRAGAYHEVLATYSQRRAEENREDLSEYVDGVEGDGWDEVTQEWRERSFMEPFTVSQGWRDERRIYELTLPANGYFVDMSAPETLATVATAMESSLTVLGVDVVDLSLATSLRRDVTTAIAEWVHGLVLDDGGLAHGIRYASRHGHGNCWAVWLREVDSGEPLAKEPTKRISTSDIKLDDQDLQRVFGLLGLRGF